MIAKRSGFKHGILALLIVLLAAHVGAAQEVELTMLWWVGDDGTEGSRNERAILDLFEELHPNIKVTTIFADWGNIPDQATVLTAAGQAPDVMWVREDTLFDLATNGILQDLTPYIERDPDFDPANFVPGVLESARVLGVQYALHRDVWAPSVFYNATWFDEAGVAYPSEGWTYDDLLDISQRLTDRETGRFGMGSMDSARFSHIFSFGGTYMNEDQTRLTWDAPGTVEAITMMHGYRWVHHVEPQPGELADWHEPQWTREEVAMQFWGPWAWPDYTAQLTFNWDVAPPLHGPAGAYTHLDGLLLGMSSQTSHPEEAWQLVKFLGYSREAQTEQVRRGMASPTVRYPETLEAFYLSDNAPKSVDNYIAALLAGSTSVPRLPGRITEIFDETLNAILDDEVNIQSAIEDGQRRAQAILDEVLSSQ